MNVVNRVVIYYTVVNIFQAHKLYVVKVVNIH